MKHIKKQKTIIHNQKNLLIVILEIKMTVFRDKYFKRTIINKLKNLKKNMNIRLKDTEDMKTNQMKLLKMAIFSKITRWV